jgi:hypothetical protein
MDEKQKKEKEEALARILKDKSNVVRLVPGPTYRDKMQTGKPKWMDFHDGLQAYAMSPEPKKAFKR